MALFLVHHPHTAGLCPIGRDTAGPQDEGGRRQFQSHGKEVRILTEWEADPRRFGIAILEATSLERAEGFACKFGRIEIREITQPMAEWLLEAMLGRAEPLANPV